MLSGLSYTLPLHWGKEDGTLKASSTAVCSVTLSLSLSLCTTRSEPRTPARGNYLERSPLFISFIRASWSHISASVPPSQAVKIVWRLRWTKRALYLLSDEKMLTTSWWTRVKCHWIVRGYTKRTANDKRGQHYLGKNPNGTKPPSLEIIRRPHIETFRAY